ncbi:MAG: histidine--tRNA ligase [Phycisphaerales bacterium]|nr:histidine--tRNA ligase [Phycisphaerales bacterium]
MSAPAPRQPPKGTRDFYPPEMAVRRHIEKAWRESSIDHGFDEIDGPTFEHLALYTVKSGDGIINELFSFRRAGGEDDYALRPEFTPTLARMVAARASSLPQPIKWFAIPTHFRAERPQRGRLREFIQWNVDLIGVEGPQAEVDVLSTAVVAMERLGLSHSDVRVKLSHRGVVAAALHALGAQTERLADAFALLDRRDKMEPSEFDARALAIGLGASATTRLAMIARTQLSIESSADTIAGALGCSPTDAQPLVELNQRLISAGLGHWCDLDFGIVRGLAYYTGSVFEVHEASGAERAIAGGGRYDKLIESFGGPSMPAVGFGMGDVVIGLLLRDRGKLPSDDDLTLLPRPDVFLVSAGSPEAEQLLPQLAASMRRAGLHVRHTYKTTRNVGKLLSEAVKCRARHALILGGELEQGMIAWKDLGAGTQSLIPVGEVVARILAVPR